MHPLTHSLQFSDSFVAHWVWADNGWLAERGVHDFAGGVSCCTSFDYHCYPCTSLIFIYHRDLFIYWEALTASLLSYLLVLEKEDLTEHVQIVVSVYCYQYTFTVSKNCILHSPFMAGNLSDFAESSPTNQLLGLLVSVCCVCV